jgi:DNA-binding CsgD family transcriptional regulator
MSNQTTLRLLCDALDAMQRARNLDELRVEMDRFAKAMGFENFAYVLTINGPSLKPQQHVISGFSREWLTHYVSQGYFKVDPVVEQAHKSSLPVIWEDHIFKDSKSDAFWEDARAFGLRAGVSFTVQEQPGVRGIFSLARDKPLDLRGLDLAALIGRAQMFASLLHQAVVRIDLPRLLPEHKAVLTAREQECLKWAADGKTAWEIGQIVGITERTAVFHINNVIQKLGAANKTQAIVRAVALKLV